MVVEAGQYAFFIERDPRLLSPRVTIEEANASLRRVGVELFDYWALASLRAINSEKYSDVGPVYAIELIEKEGKIRVIVPLDNLSKHGLERLLEQRQATNGENGMPQPGWVQKQIRKSELFMYIFYPNGAPYKSSPTR